MRRLQPKLACMAADDWPESAGAAAAAADLGPRDLGVVSQADAALGHKVVDATPPLLVAGVPAQGLELGW